ncbi:hypothetical protein [Actinomadura xylanilytica]|uniref:hypothetical protein n=1 Tax=Actinomadura xylanilytica TaxID=887459 RepID=UPI00255AF48C|nr:hypothetical protein [Actinomadura xylanilytica]MDL4771392.1 hypothetical protein [Actinomadura xylanilytica]
MTTHPDDEHSEILRRALHAEADEVIPAGDGLERIRARIEQSERRRVARYWLTPGWTRPVLAVAAAVAIAGIGVSAPQTISLIQQSVGNNGPSGKSHDDSTDADRTATTSGPDGQPVPASPGEPGSGTPSEPPSSEPATAPGSPLCASSPAAAGAGASPGRSAPIREPGEGDTAAGKPCGTGQTPPTTPLPSPTTTTPKPTDPDPPTEPPTEEPPTETPSASESSSASSP